jgi:hypothetical protein
MQVFRRLIVPEIPVCRNFKTDKSAIKLVPPSRRSTETKKGVT